jgi:hypothetical protein
VLSSGATPQARYAALALEHLLFGIQSMTQNSLRNTSVAGGGRLLAAGLIALGGFAAASGEVSAQTFFAQPAVVAAPAQPVFAAPAAVTFVPEARGLFGRRIAYRPVVTFPAAAAPVTTFSPAVVTAGFAPVATPLATPVATTTFFAPQVATFQSPQVTTFFAPQVATTSFHAPAVASPGCGCSGAVAAPVTSFMPATVAGGCSSCSATTSFFAPVVAAPVAVAPIGRLPHDPPVPFTGLFALPN